MYTSQPSVGQLADLVHDVDRARVQTHVRATGLGQLQPLVVEIHGDHQAWVLETRRREHPQPERAGAGDHDDVAEFDIPALHGVDRACQRLDIGGVRDRNLPRHFMVDGIAGEAHVLGHRAKRALAKTVHIVFEVAHPILAAPAKATFPTGDDLLGDSQIAELQTVFLTCAFAQSDNLSDELVARDDRRLAVPFAMLVAPKHWRAGVTFQVAGADADRFDSDDDLAGLRLRRRPFFQTVVARPVADHRLHGVG
jgi:hypothetical protein